MPVGFRISECINKLSTQLCMWYLMQHVSILVAHLQVKHRIKNVKTLDTVAFPSIPRSPFTFPVLRFAVYLV